MPSFRGEDADDTHLCQFFHSEAEVPGDLDAVIETAETYVRELTRGLVEDVEREILAVAGTLDHLEDAVAAPEWPRVTLAEVRKMLDADSPAWRETPLGIKTLTRAGERMLMDRLGGPVWVTHWDHALVPFYQAFEEGTGNALNADLLMGPGEVIGAGQRHADDNEVRAALDMHGVAAEPYDWYLEMKRSFPMATAGFGMGVERYLMWVLQHYEIRDFELVVRRNGRPLRP
jgi:asparaginyl-tRNA synthetase